tara:strand:- start:138 stop:470 length:333 start_codon:yes stop_codon:yes gene_type:complete
LATLLHNITSTVTKELLALGDNVSAIKSIVITNVDLNNASFVDFYLFDKTNNASYYLVKNKKINKGSTLILNPTDGVTFDNSINGYSLRAQASDGQSVKSAVSVDVVINR